MSTETKFICAVCTNPVIYDTNSEIKTIPILAGSIALCSNCTEKGWLLCDTCNKPYNRNNTNQEDFHTVFSMFFFGEYLDKKKYCSNECFNIHQLKREQNYYYQEISKLDVLGLPEEITPEDKERIKHARERIEELDDIINRIS